MRTPAGFECPYFYGDYRRGRHREECRLIGDTPPPRHYTPDLCAKCPIPGVLRANACDNMNLTLEVQPGILGKIAPFGAKFGRKLVMSAYCRKSHQTVSEPHVGCGQCHDLSDLLAN